MMMPVARLALLRAYPRSELLPILNFVTIPGLVGPVLGPLLGGILVTYATWHWIFIINIPIGILGIIYAIRHMPDFTMPKRRFDTLGFALLGAGLVSVSVSLDLFGDNALAAATPFLVMGSGFALLTFYALHARRISAPIIPLSLFRTRTFSVGIAGNVATRLGTGCIPFLMPLMLQVGFGYPAVVAGMMMAPTAIGSILAKSAVTQILRRYGYRLTLFAITLVIGAIISSFYFQSPGMSIYLLVLPLFILGMAMSTQFTAMNTITLADLTEHNASSGNSVLAVTQQLSISFGIAVSASVLRYFESQDWGSIVDNFHATFVTVGVMTILSAFVFLFLSRTDGRNMIKKKTRPSDSPASH